MCPSVSRGASHAVDFLLWPCCPVEHFLHSDWQEVWTKTVYQPVGAEEDNAMAEQRPPGSGGTSPTPERGTQGRETTPEVSTQVTETARHVGEAASQAYEQGRQQLAGWEQSFEENIRAKPLQSVLLATGIGLLLGLLWRK
jgi:ElaB/YqjD/DUF883 family membrane-anchored ribosome-binding protein